MLVMLLTDSGRRRGVYGASMASPFDGMSSVSCLDGESGSSPSSISSMATTYKNVAQMILNVLIHLCTMFQLKRYNQLKMYFLK